MVEEVKQQPRGMRPNEPLVNKARPPPWKGKPMNRVRLHTILVNEYRRRVGE